MSRDLAGLWLPSFSGVLAAFLLLFSACGPDKPATPARTNLLDPSNPLAEGDPFELTLQRATSPPSTGIHLFWIHPGSIGIEGFRVYRRTTPGASWTQLTDLGAAARAYSDTTTVGWQTYSYQIRAVDAERGESATRETVPTIRSAPLALLDGGVSCSNEVTLRVAAVDADWVRVAETQAGLDVVPEWALPDTGLTIPWTLPSGPGRRSVWVRVGNNAAESEQVSASIDVVEAPAVPDSVMATADCGMIVVSWQAVIEATGYRVYRDGALVTPQAVAELSWTDPTPPSGVHTYRVSARGVCEGRQSGATIAVAALSTRPAAPTGMLVSARCFAIWLGWNQVTGASSYRVYRDHETNSVAEVDAAEWVDRSPGSTSHVYAVTSVVSGSVQCNESLKSAPSEGVTASSCPEGFVFVPAGEFTMGSPRSEPGRRDNESQHEVTLTHVIYVSMYEVTQSEWQAVMGWNTSWSPGANHPVEMVTWYDAVSYCNQRSAGEGLTAAYRITAATYTQNHITSATVTWNQAANGYRLLTEAEWEYACRATSTTAFCNGGITNISCSPLDPNLDQVGWYCGNASNVTHDVGGKTENAWGLKDMHGNVGEWCWDRYGTYPAGPVTDPTGPASGSNRILRGGGSDYTADGCRSAYRGLGRDPGVNTGGPGLRLSMTAP